MKTARPTPHTNAAHNSVLCAMKIDINDIKSLIDRFEAKQEEISPVQAEREMAGILSGLFRGDGYEMSHTGGVGDRGVDYLAENAKGDRVMVQYKHYQKKRPIGISEVQSVMGAAVLEGFERAVLLANTQFSHAAQAILHRELPVEFQLMNLDSLRSWVERIEHHSETEISPVARAVKMYCSTLARHIAKNPRILDEIEWRDMERVLAEVFDSFGFEVELTPSAKDGGKDIVLSCIASGHKKKFLVEVKHWRSGQKVGSKKLKDFVQVVAIEQAEKGLFLSTYGFASNAVEALTEIEKQQLSFGEESKVVSMCKLFVRIESGLWLPPSELPELLFEDTL